MVDVTETQLPGVGVRYEFTTSGGQRMGVLSHHGGRREVFEYDPKDPDAAARLMDLDNNDARTLTELLGASHVSETLGQMHQQVEGLSIDWLEVPAASPLAGRSIGDSELRTKTGTSVVAVIRGPETNAAPGPEFVLNAGDLLVAVGTADGVETLRSLLQG